jgi:hypothetical protein
MGLSAMVRELEARIKPEQEKAVTITENGTTDVLPDGGSTLSKVAVTVDVPTSGGTEELENLIDESGVLESTEGATISDKVNQLIDKATIEKHIYNASLRKGNCQYEFEYYPGKKLPLTNYTKAQFFNYFAANSAIETVDYYLDWNNNNKSDVNMLSAFELTTNLKTMVGINTKYAGSVSSLFNKSGIVSIERPFDFSNITGPTNTTAFTTAVSLEEVRFVDETIKWSIMFASSVLSVDSIQSIIYGLATVTNSQKLTLHSNVAAKLTDTQYEILYSKNWTLG